MVSKTIEKKRQSKKHKHKRRTQTKTKKNKVTHDDHASAASAAVSATPAQVIKSHRFMSSMTFDGNTLTTKTQKDNEPVIEHRYTKEQLAREIPIGKEMVDMYLDGKMPKGLQQHHRNHTHRIGKKRGPVFQNVLISPADLGLLPSRISNDEEVYDDPREYLFQPKKLIVKDLEKRNRNNNYYDDDDDARLEMIINENNKKKRLFDLP
jgi:hypothetical protein